MQTGNSSINRTMGAREWAMLLTLSVLWGGSFFFASVALEELPPLSIVFLRVGIAAIILNILVRMLGARMPGDRRVWQVFFGMGLINNVVPFCLIVWGQTQIASGLAAILNATTPFFTVILAHFMTSDEKMSGNRMFGILAGLAGVVVIIGPEVLAGLGSNALAQFAILAAAISYAIAGVYGRRFKSMGVTPMQTATGQSSASAVMLVPIALFVDRPWTFAMPGMNTWLAIFGIAALSTALGYILYFRILATAGATNLLLVTFLVPVSAILLGSLFLAEVLEPKHFAGMVLIGLGLVLIDGRVFARLRTTAGSGAS